MDSVNSISSASYWQYKDDTSYVLKWIEQTAKACGWKRQQAKQTIAGPSTLKSSTGAKGPIKDTTDTKGTAGSGRLKGKDRKTAKRQAAADQAVAAEKENEGANEKDIVYNALEILSQTNLISTCLSTSPSRVSPPPPSVIHALGRAIKLRQTFSDWFESARPNDQRSNSAHRYFIKVLEKIANIFLQAAGADATGSKDVNTGNTVSGVRNEVSLNRYECLLEQASQEDPEDESAQSIISSGRSTAGEATKPSRKYHMEVKDSHENALMVFALFTDLHDIKTEMKSLWKRCFKDGADMVVASLMTAQTLAFVQGLEERAISTVDPPKYQHEAADQEDHQNHSWTFRGTYCRLLNILRDSTDAQAVTRFEDSCHRTGNKGEPVNMNDLTFAFTARRLSKLTGGVNGEFCEPLLLHFKHNPLALLNSERGGEIVERDENLCCLLAEMVYLRYASPSQGPYRNRTEREIRFESIRKDPILSSLHPVWTQKEVNITSVIAAEIMLDIKELSDAFPTARPSYEATYDKYMNLLGLEADTNSAGKPILKQTQESSFLLGLGAPGWDSKVKEAMDKVLSMLPVPNTRGSDPSSEQPQHREPTGCIEAREIYEELDPPRLPLMSTKEDYLLGGVFDMIWLPKTVHYFFEHYSMFSTHRQAFMETLTESIGIEILNHADRHGLGAMVHIYNAARQMGLGNLQWPAMDRLIELHKVALFAGDPPTDATSMLKRFSHRYWAPSRPMSRKQKVKIMNRAVTQMKPSAMTQAFNQHWDTSGRIPYWYTLEANALAAATEKKAARKNTPATKQSFVENMPAMERYLTEQLLDVRVDYLEIDRVSAVFNQDLLKHARAVFDKQPNRILQEEELDLWSGLDFVSEAFEQEAEFHEARAKADGDPSKLPVQDCDYLQDSINCLASTLRSKGIGVSPAAAADGEEYEVRKIYLTWDGWFLCTVALVAIESVISEPSFTVAGGSPDT